MEVNDTKKLNTLVWPEFYRPTKIKDMVLPNQFKQNFLKMVSENNVPNLLLYSSSPGVGKTTLAKALCNEIGADYKYINVSSENGIDTLRGNISKFASTRSFSGGQKIVIMDECDGATLNLQQGLRASIEQFHKVCRFIFTCNYISKIIEPLRSRCQEFDMNFTDEKTKLEMIPLIKKRIIKILQHKKIDFVDETIDKIVSKYHPDIRKMIQICQQYSNINNFIDNNIFEFARIDSELYEYIEQKKFNKARTHIIQKNYNFSELYTDLYRNFVPRLPKEKQPNVIIVLADYQFKHSQVVDQEINFSACLLELMSNI